jgi:hypothetical protein
MIESKQGTRVEVRKKRPGILAIFGDKTVASYTIPYGAHRLDQLGSNFPAVSWKEIFNRDVVVFRRNVIIARDPDASRSQEHAPNFAAQSRGHEVRFGIVPERSNLLKKLLNR